MTMTNCMAFHTQIASVMEVLANAAVAEICKLVDNDYAVFRLEISQSQKENRGLRRKLQVLELKMARDRAERTMRERLLANRPNVTTVKIHDRFRGAKGEGHLLGSHRGLGKPVVHSVWKDDPPISVVGGETSSQGIITIEESADADDADSGSSLVKQGRSDSEERQLHSRDIHASAPPSATEDITAPAWTRRCVTESVEVLEVECLEVCQIKKEGSEDGLGNSEGAIMEDNLAGATDKQADQQRQGLSQPEDMEDDQPGSLLVVKQEAGQNGPGSSNPYTADHDGTGAEACIIKEEREEEVTGTSNQHGLKNNGESLMSRAVNGEDWISDAGPRIWSCTPQENPLYHHEPEPEPNREGPRLGHTEHNHWTGILDNVNPDHLKDRGASQQRSFSSQRRDVAVAVGPSCSYDVDSTEPTINPVGRPIHRVENRSGGNLSSTSGSQMLSAWDRGPGAVSIPNLTHLPHGYLNTTHSARMGPEHERYLACFNTHYPNAHTMARGCSKTNTGGAVVTSGASGQQGPGRTEARSREESAKPYSCPTCGKRFAEANYVKKHQTVHTKERPFKCKLCGKSFSFLSNLIRHRGVHNAEKT